MDLVKNIFIIGSCFDQNAKTSVVFGVFLRAHTFSFLYELILLWRMRDMRECKIQ